MNMKKIIFLMIAVIVGIMVYCENNEIIIPSEAIRFRIVANSNSISDLYKKWKLKDDIASDIYSLVSNANSYDDARIEIVNNLDSIDKIISSKTKDYKINYGMNYFPRKTYKGVIYPAGEYESLVVTLGEGLGDNWWCVLYPPLCMINDNETVDNVSYRSYVMDILNN